MHLVVNAGGQRNLMSTSRRPKLGGKITHDFKLSQWHEQETSDYLVAVWVQPTIGFFFFRKSQVPDIIIQSLSEQEMLECFLFVLKIMILAKLKVACI